MDATASTATQTGKPFGSFGYRTYVLLTLTIVYTFNFIDRILITVVGRPIIEEFGLSNFQYGLLTGIGFALFYTFLGIPIASFSERYNRVRIIGVCVILWSVATVLCGFTYGFITLLLARMLVGVGEAGCTPPANSLISDYYHPSARPTALGIYAMGITFGGVLAQLFGGWIITNLSWREAFIYLGAPGILVGLLVLFTVKEPPRGYSDPPGTTKPERASFPEALREITSKPTFWTMTVGATLAAFAGYSLTGFLPLFVQYTHDLGPGPTAIYYMAPVGLAGTFGAFAGGYLTEKLTPKSPTAASWVPGVAFIACVPFYFAGLYAGGLGLMLIMLLISGFLHYFYLGAQYNIAQSVVSLRARATSIAVLLFIVNLIGFGAGPPTAGFIADHFTSSKMAASSLTPALCQAKDTLTSVQAAACEAALAHGVTQACAIIASLYVLAGVFFILSGRTLLRDKAAQTN